MYKVIPQPNDGFIVVDGEGLPVRRFSRHLRDADRCYHGILAASDESPARGCDLTYAPTKKGTKEAATAYADYLNGRLPKYLTKPAKREKMPSKKGRASARRRKLGKRIVRIIPGWLPKLIPRLRFATAK